MQKATMSDTVNAFCPRRTRPAFTLVEIILLLVLLVLLGILIAWGVRRTNRVASLKALRDLGVEVSTSEGDVLEGIGFANCFLGDDVMVTHVANLGTFKTLLIPNTDVSDVGLRAIPDPAAIVSLDLALTGISDDSLKFIGENCPNLEALDLTATLISDAGIGSLTGLQKLKILSLSGCRVTDNAVAHLTKIASLTELHLDYTSLTRDGLEALRPNPRLKTVRTHAAIERPVFLPEDFADELTPPPTYGPPGLSQNATVLSSGHRFKIGSKTVPEQNRRIAVEESAVGFVQQAAGNAYGNLHITRVDLTSTNVDDDDVRSLYPLRMLSILQLSNTGLSDDFHRHVAGFRHLEVLQISKTAVSDETVRQIARLTQLRELDLRRTQITDHSLKYLVLMDNLLVLDLSDTAITDEGLRDFYLLDRTVNLINDDPPLAAGVATSTAFVQQASRGLRVLGLSGTQITDRSINTLLEIPALQEISVGRTGISEEGLARLRKEFRGQVRLEFFKFHPAWPIGE